MAEKGKDKGKGGAKKETIARYYTVKDGKVTRKNTWCPKCGPGIFLAAHGNRMACGKCGYTEFKKEAGQKK
jgi:small subunit ribosomal protein S27Ae